MIIAGQVQYAVKHEYPDLIRNRMSEGACVAGGDVGRNSDISR